jgi:trehalose/maltose transport system permease protein
MLWDYTKTTLFYLLVALIVVIAVFPFYYAILTSFEKGTAIFEVNYLPIAFDLSNYKDVLTTGTFPRNLMNSVMVSSSVVVLSLFLAVTAAYALSRFNFRGRGLLLLTILGVSMFPQIAVLAGLFELVRFSVSSGLALASCMPKAMFSFTVICG